MKQLFLTLCLIAIHQFSIAQPVSKAQPYELSETYSGLRALVLEINTEQATAQGDVLALIMETGYPEAVMTLVAVADGTTSIYFSNGGGILGAGEYPQVQEVALEVLAEGDAYRSLLKKTKEAPLPSPSYTHFHLVTTDGILTGQALEEQLGNEQHELSPLFFACHKLIAYVRKAEELRSNNN